MKKTNTVYLELPAPEAAFSRATLISHSDMDMIYVSGTASVGSRRETLHRGDFEAQCRRAYQNVEGILEAERFLLQDVVKWTIYLKEMKYYARFNKVRSRFFRDRGISPCASTCVEAKLCRPDLLVEMEAVAIRPAGRKYRFSSRAYRRARPAT
ncbi:MAG TPA: RidA family protein [Elusimicrobiota bacterium]|nr:RidA family protein [Elusimicrobiota bacterium]